MDLKKKNQGGGCVPQVKGKRGKTKRGPPDGGDSDHQRVVGDHIDQQHVLGENAGSIKVREAKVKTAKGKNDGISRKRIIEK